MPEDTEDNGRDEKGKFTAGNSGRPKGARNKLTDLFFNDLYAKWQEKGASAIDAMIADRPGDFVKVVANVMPKEFSLNEHVIGDLTEAEIGDFLAALRSFKAASVGEPARSATEDDTRH